MAVIYSREKRRNRDLIIILNNKKIGLSLDFYFKINIIIKLKN